MAMLSQSISKAIDYETHFWRTVHAAFHVDESSVDAKEESRSDVARRSSRSLFQKSGSEGTHRKKIKPGSLEWQR